MHKPEEDTLDNALSGFDRTMGVRMLKISRDEVVIEYDVDERHRQPYGIVHGGMHCAAVETACSTGAGMDALARGQSVVGVENHTSFIRAIRSGTVRVTATPITRGRRSQVWEATARNEEGKVVATGRVRLLCLDPGSQLGGEVVPQRESE
ncbi:MAG TPA: PaaI family thioesterase [Candidatus Acidoferrales bacterium]|nr:PaaI family thioesterase [Candidatus Acidoferrales bacterium]